MERKEAYEQIKKLGLQEECKRQFGKNFTQCKTSELEVVIKAFKVVLLPEFVFPVTNINPCG